MKNEMFFWMGVFWFAFYSSPSAVAADPMESGKMHKEEVSLKITPTLKQSNDKIKETETETRSLPKMKKITIFDMSDLNDSEKVLLASMQGQLAKQGVYLYLASSLNDFWIDEIEKLEVDILKENNLKKLLEKHVLSFAGYVRCDMDNVRIGATVGGPMKALVVTPESESLVNAVQLKLLSDVSGKSDDWLYNYVLDNKSLYNLSGITQHNVDRPSTLIDHAIANNYICMQGMDNPELVRRFYQLIETASPKFGFGTPFKDEFKDVGLSAEEGLYTIPSANAYNLSFYSATKTLFDPPQKRNDTGTINPDQKQKVHYVMIMMSDGDNLSWHTGGLATLDKYMNNPHCKDIPMSWMYPPEMIDVAPFLHNYYVHNYPPSNNLLGGVSGAGYTFPSIHKDLEKYAVKTNRLLKKNGLDYCVIMDFQDFKTQQREVLKQMWRFMPDVDGLFYMDYGNYAKWNGEIYFIDGKPVISFKYRLWLPMDPIEKIAEAINKAPRTPDVVDGYSAVVVHAWSYGMDDVARFVDLLDDDVRLVGANDFVRLININLNK